MWEEFVLKPEALRKRVATRLPCGAKKFQLQVFVHAANVMKHPWGELSEPPRGSLPDPPSIFLSPIFRNGRGAEGLGTGTRLV